MARPQRMVTIDGKAVPWYTFFYSWQAGLHKAFIFGAHARRHLQDGLLVPAAISFYYFMFHLSLVMSLMAPDLLAAKVQKTLRKKLDKSPDTDPTRDVRHESVECFLLKQQSGVSARFAQVFQGAQALRVFVNYAPRVHLTPTGPEWMTTAHEQYEAYLRAFIDGLDIILDDFVGWTMRFGSDADWILSALALGHPEPFSDRQFMYVAWCPNDVIRDARGLRERVASALGARLSRVQRLGN